MAEFPKSDDVLAATRPRVTAAQAETLVGELYGLTGTARPMPGERDANFHIRTSDDRDFVLKVTNAAEDPGVSDLQTRALLHIAANDPGLPVPRPWPTNDGRPDARVALGGSHHLVRLLTYLQGEPLHRTRPSVEQAASLGGCLAALDLALRSLHHPAAGHDLLWDLQRAARLRPLLPCIGNKGLRALATAGLDRFDKVIAPRQATLRRQVVHHDLNLHNVLVDPVTPARITGVLDFGDLVETALVNDVAVAAAYQVEGADPLERPVALVAAYHGRYPLLPVEVDMLFDLVTLRLVQSVTIAEWRASLDPDNAAYLLRNQARGAAALDSLDRIGPGKGGLRFRQACAAEKTP